MDPNQLNREQLLELVGQILGHMKISAITPGSIVPGTRIPAIQEAENEEDPIPLTIQEVPAVEPSSPTVPQVQLRRPWTQLPAVLVEFQDDASESTKDFAGKRACGAHQGRGRITPSRCLAAPRSQPRGFKQAHQDGQENGRRRDAGVVRVPRFRGGRSILCSMDQTRPGETRGIGLDGRVPEATNRTSS